MDSKPAVKPFIERRPETCEFRYPGASESSSCELLSRILDPLGRATATVSLSSCVACCKYTQRVEPRLNPTLASLAHSMCQELLQRQQLDAQTQVDLHHAKAFASSWLSTVNNTGVRVYGTPINYITPERPAVRNVNGKLRIGLVGPSSGFGLAHLNRELALQLHVDRWLIPGSSSQDSNAHCRIDQIARAMSSQEMEAWMEGLDVVVFVERPHFANLTQTARRLGIYVVCIPMWEWLSPTQAWLHDINLMLCPAYYTFNRLQSWRQRFGFSWQVFHLPWPVNLKHFDFRIRRTCHRFVYVNGSGGSTASILGSSPGDPKHQKRRKGLDVLLAAAKMAPSVPIIVYADDKELSVLPQNVELRQLPRENELLYIDGDVCIQPSRWEGLGLPLLECQAAGMPLITSDAAPMNEHEPMHLIPVQTTVGKLTSEISLPVAEPDPVALAAIMRSLHGRNISSHSKRARQFVEQSHNWQTAATEIHRIIKNSLFNVT